MTFLELIQILGAVYGLAKDGTEIVDALHKLGYKPGDTIPAAYIAKLRDSVAAIPSADDKAWDINHENSGG